jgi:hypothetical protein
VPEIGFPLASRDELDFTYQGFGTSYLLEFSAPRWVQCAYNPPYADEEGEENMDDAVSAGVGDDGEDDDAESGGGSWSCPSKPPELW